MKVDTLIIGSGVAATVVSETLLAADPKASILILEAGTRVKTKDFGLWENYLITNKLPYEAYWDLAYPSGTCRAKTSTPAGRRFP
jgi:choline dehydrogenase-like flavoprotein